MKKRYQDCNMITKIFRNLWKLTIPFITMFYFITRKRVYKDEIIDGVLHNTDEYFVMDLSMCWSIACGEIDMKMNHYYTSEEVKKQIFDKYKI